MILWPLGAALITSLAALAGSGAILLLGSRAERASLWILSFAIGTLTGAATLHLLPEALEQRSAGEVMPVFLAGMIAFIAIERAIRWRHTHPHGDAHQHHEAATAEVLLWGDALHNFIDGLVLGVTFAASTELGLVTAFAVFAHEVPQEIGDFAILLGTGMERRRALLLNYLSAVPVIPGALLAFVWASSLQSAIGWLLPLAAGAFVYIALADLVPSLHHRRGKWSGVVQIALVIAGAAVVWLAGRLFHEG